MPSVNDHLSFVAPEQPGSLYPFSVTRPVEDIRVGILTIREKWERLLAGKSHEGINPLQIPAWILPDRKNVDTLLAGDWEGDFLRLLRPWDIFLHNHQALLDDFELITSGRSGIMPDESNRCLNLQQIFIEPGARVRHSILNAELGPIYIGSNAEIMEGCIIRGPFAMGEGAVLKMGTRVYGATTIGPYCIAGGEIKNSVMMAFSNKAHDGYLGDSVIGEWCNLGAGTTGSNMRNTASGVRVWNNVSRQFEPAGLKCGLLMGDYSRSAINTSFNTGTVVGLCCHVFGDGMPPKHLPDFSWGNERYDWERALRDIRAWKALKGKQLSKGEEEILKRIYQQ